MLPTYLLTLTVALAILLTLSSIFLLRKALRLHKSTAKMRSELRDLRLSHTETLDALDKLTVLSKRKYMRDVTRERRAQEKEKKANGLPDPAENPDEWKKAMQRAYALGEFKPK